MAKRLIPLLDRVLVEKLAPPTKTVGGVLLPETASKVRAACWAHSRSTKFEHVGCMPRLLRGASFIACQAQRTVLLLVVVPECKPSARDTSLASKSWP